jgi:hypothetical protein
VLSSESSPSARERRQAKPGTKRHNIVVVSFVCGVIQHRRTSRLDKSRWSWPLGRLELKTNEVRAYTPIFLGRFALHIPYSSIAGAVATPSRLGGHLRLRRTGDSGDVTIATFNDDYRRIASVLREKGVDVVDG